MSTDRRTPYITGAVAAPDHVRDHEELAALIALGVLEGDELEVAKGHLARCARCRLVVAGDRVAVGALATTAPEREAPSGFKARLLERAGRELTPSSVLTPSGAPLPRLAPPPFSESRPVRPRRDLAAWLLPVAALFFAVFAGTAAIGQQLGASQVVASRQLEGSAGAGAATVLVRRSGDASLQLSGLAAPPSGGVYQAWLMGPDGLPVPAGAATSGSATIPLEGDARGKTVALTVEPRPGARAPSAAPILTARVPA